MASLELTTPFEASEYIPAVAGIDPGKSGACAIMFLNNKLECQAIEVFPLPLMVNHSGKKEIDSFLLKGRIHLIEENHEASVHTIALESVHTMPGQGVVSSANFMKGYGKILATLELMGNNVIHVSPQRWVNEILQPKKKKASKKKKKEKRNKEDSIRYVQQVFPEVNLIPKGCRVPQDGLAEAVLIAEYARRYVAGQLHEKTKSVKSKAADKSDQ